VPTHILLLSMVNRVLLGRWPPLQNTGVPWGSSSHKRTSNTYLELLLQVVLSHGGLLGLIHLHAQGHARQHAASRATKASSTPRHTHTRGRHAHPHPYKHTEPVGENKQVPTTPPSQPNHEGSEGRHHALAKLCGVRPKLETNARAYKHPLPAPFPGWSWQLRALWCVAAAAP
jgi:hypothetical protein